MVVHISGENSCIVKKINICPVAAVRFNIKIVARIDMGDDDGSELETGLGRFINWMPFEN